MRSLVLEMMIDDPGVARFGFHILTLGVLPGANLVKRTTLSGSNMEVDGMAPWKTVLPTGGFPLLCEIPGSVFVHRPFSSCAVAPCWNPDSFS